MSGFNGLEKTQNGKWMNPIASLDASIGKWMTFKDKRSANGQIHHQNNKEVLAVYEINHQECDMVFKSRRRRRVKCHNEIPNHGRSISLFTPFSNAEKWLYHQ